MPEFKPFRAWRYAPGADLAAVTAPPYDVLSDAQVAAYGAHDPHNIVHVDVPPQTPAGYAGAAATLSAWMADGTLVRDTRPKLTLYRLSFTDATGVKRQILGVLGALAVMDYPAAGARRDTTAVLPHENVTKKASTDRLDLTRATGCNLSPVWGLSLAAGLTKVLQQDWEYMDDGGPEPPSLTEDGVTHEFQVVDEREVIADIQALMRSADVLIADGHHRYGVAQQYREERRAAGEPEGGPASFTLAFINELVDDQLSVEAIHRVYDGISFDALRDGLATCFDLGPAPAPTPAILAEMKAQGRLVLLAPDGTATWLTPKPGALDGVRNLDGALLEHALAGVDGLTATYDHDLAEILAGLGSHTGAVLIRPTSIDEIRRTATEGLLMPPKSTFFTPKLRTGLVIRQIDE